MIEHEIVVLEWDAGEAGLTVADVWKAIADLFGGSMAQLVQSLLDGRGASADEIERM